MWKYLYVLLHSQFVAISTALQIPDDLIITNDKNQFKINM